VAFSASSRIFDLNGEAKTATTTTGARSFRQLRRFHHVSNPDKVLGTHSIETSIRFLAEMGAHQAASQEPMSSYKGSGGPWATPHEERIA